MDWRILTAITVTTWALYSVILKRVAGQTAWPLSLFMFVLGYAALVGVYGLFQPEVSLSAVASRRAAWPFVAGVVCGVGGIAFFRALPHAPGSVFLPLVSLSMVFSGVLCAVFLHEPVTRRLVLGVLLAAGAVVLLAK